MKTALPIVMGLAWGVLSWGGLAWGGPATAETTPPVVEVLRLTPTIYMLRTNTDIGNPTTVVSIGSDGVFLVDANFASASDSLLATVRRLGGGPVRLIATTHYHGDHTEGLERFAPPAIALAPAAQRRRLAQDSVFLGERPIRSASLPAVTFSDSLGVHFNGETIAVFTPPVAGGHTDGDAFVYFARAKILCVGDYLILDKFPVIDAKGGGDLEGYLSVIGSMIDSLPESTIVIPGHGTFYPATVEAVTLERWKANLDALQATVDFVKTRMTEGWTLERLIEVGLPKRFASFGAKPRYVSEARWIRYVFDYYRRR